MVTAANGNHFIAKFGNISKENNFYLQRCKTILDNCFDFCSFLQNKTKHLQIYDMKLPCILK